VSYLASGSVRSPTAVQPVEALLAALCNCAGRWHSTLRVRTSSRRPSHPSWWRRKLAVRPLKLAKRPPPKKQSKPTIPCGRLCDERYKWLA